MGGSEKNEAKCETTVPQIEGRMQMSCPKCGFENPDDVHACGSCGLELGKETGSAETIAPRRSGLAIVALVFGVLSPLFCGLTALPAVPLAIIAIIQIELSGGRVTGRNIAIIGIVASVITFYLLPWPILLEQRRMAFRMVCGSNLAGIGKGMLGYAADYDGQFPRSGGADSRWAGTIENWKAPDRYAAYGLSADGAGGVGSISSSFYLLVKYAEVLPELFICPGDRGTSVFDPADEHAGDKKLAELWDFGARPIKRCSYSYHQPFGLYPLTKSSNPGMAIAADRNPFIRSPMAEPKNISLFVPDGGRSAINMGNAYQHNNEGQNVLFVDSHVGFEKNPCCGVDDDNIYTFWDGGDIRRGALPYLESASQDESDSLLVNDGY